MAADSDEPDEVEARAMLDSCASLGAKAVDLTLTAAAAKRNGSGATFPLPSLGACCPQC
jgi:hypothetical protein